MMRALWWMLCAGLLSCRAEPDHKTIQGVRVWDSYGMRDYNQIDLAIGWIQQVTPYDSHAMANWLKGSDLLLTDEPIQYWPGAPISGYWDYYPQNFGVMLKDGDCPIGASALAHEMLHGYLYLDHGDYDTEHWGSAWLEHQPALDAAARRACHGE